MYIKQKLRFGMMVIIALFSFSLGSWAEENPVNNDDIDLDAVLEKCASVSLHGSCVENGIDNALVSLGPWKLISQTMVMGSKSIVAKSSGRTLVFSEDIIMNDSNELIGAKFSEDYSTEATQPKTIAFRGGSIVSKCHSSGMRNGIYEIEIGESSSGVKYQRIKVVSSKGKLKMHCITPSGGEMEQKIPSTIPLGSIPNGLYDYKFVSDFKLHIESVSTQPKIIYLFNHSQ